MWNNMKKAAIAGAAHMAVSAEQATRRLDLHRRLGEQEGQLEAHYAALGRLTAAAVREGRVQLPGAQEHLAGAETAEAQIARLRAELDRLGS